MMRGFFRMPTGLFPCLMEKFCLKEMLMNRNYFNWILALAVLCLFLLGFFMWKQNTKEHLELPRQAVAQPFSPFKSYISAVGIVEASSGNIYIGSPIDRMVEKVEVSVGEKVKKGDVLFRLNANDLEAELSSRHFDYENAKANLKKMESLPRPEDLEIADAQYRSAEVQLEQAKSQYERVEGLQKNGAMSEEEISRRQFAYREAEANLQQAKANFKKVQAGPWPPDIEIARLKVMQAKASAARVEAHIEKTIIRAPSDATVLQIKIHEGEFPHADYSQTPAMIIGNTDRMYLRVNINQFDASFFDPETQAVAYLQGNSTIGFPLKFVHIEPLLVAKQSLSNDITEKVDTRVLQAVYCFEDGENRVFVGQQMNVFIETHPAEET
jgi:multidrug resistance efflux pump